MEEWKVRRSLYEVIHEGKRWTDDLELIGDYNDDRTDPEEIIQDATNYFLTHSSTMKYPGKSYAIAIQFASWIEDVFGDDFYKTLSDPTLLPNDRYFVPYMEAQEIYDKILEGADVINDIKDEISLELPYLNQTKNYFFEEFLLNKEGLQLLSLKAESQARFEEIPLFESEELKHLH